MKVALFLLAAFVAACSAEIFFEESFGDGWESRWISSTAKGAEAGAFSHSAGKFYNDAEADKGLQTSTDARFYGSSAAFPEFSNEGKNIIISFRIKHEQNIDCGGGYIKVFPSGLDQEKMTGDSEYEIMFGPDICGPGTRKIHAIFRYKGKNLLIKKTVSCKTDEMSHLYTLELNADNTYVISVDGKKEESGNLADDWDFLLPKQINDPAQSKPKDWVDNKMMVDPEDTKPENFDQPAQIADPEAEKPEDWDDEMDGEWEAPQIDNPEYKGEWSPKQIENPAYKGEWVHPQIDNPDFVDDVNLYLRKPLGAVGIDVWQVKSGSIFDDLLITDDASVVADRLAAFKTLAAGEKKMKDAADAKAAEEAAAAAAAAPQEDEAEEAEADDSEEVGGDSEEIGAGHDEF